jgi:hypothetical protein
MTDSYDTADTGSFSPSVTASTLFTLASSIIYGPSASTGSEPTTLGRASVNSVGKETVLGDKEFVEMVKLLAVVKESSLPSNQDSRLPLPTSLADVPVMQLHDRDLADWTDKISDRLTDLSLSDLAELQVVRGAGLLALTGAVAWMFHKWGPVGKEKCKMILQHCRAQLRRRGVDRSNEDGYELVPINHADEASRGSIGSGVSEAEASPSPHSNEGEEEAGPGNVPVQSADDQA